ncbi:endonuclease/exonuclease/phosphatase family protein [Flammeovirga pectinis]|uniref:endonuclease/exonuclease/phosphatase family protein n=1 Tax=Flammeovirga pectinis TaxID=2494373 RepID=UPI00197A77E9|nr:endonuclease/exonuclease/phosphatase family protein [Flammeovirga pectinis]
MTNFKWSILLIIPFLFINCTKQEELSLRVLQFNIWQEGTIVPNGYVAILDEIIHTNADVIALSEVRNYEQKSLAKRLVEDLKERGFTFYSDSSQDSGILSKYPILNQEAFYPVVDDRGSVTKAIIKVGQKEIAFYSAHLDYRNCAIYLPRGYDGSTWKHLDKPVTDINLLLADNLKSKRIEAIVLQMLR